MKICILGAGALGCAIGAALSEAGHETWLLNRGRAHVEAMNQHGLRVQDERGERYVPVNAAIEAEDVGVTDLVVVLVKSFHTAEAIAGALALIGPQTLVLSLQNGLGHEDILAEVVGRERVLAGKTYVGGVLLAPGSIRAGVAGKQTFIGELDGQLTPRVQAIAEAFNNAGLATTVSDNILGTMWDKLLVNVATGALSGITMLSYGQLYSEPLLESTAKAAVAEAIAVAERAGIRLSLTSPEAAWSLAEGSAGELPHLDAAEPGKKLDHRNRLHQRLRRALGPAPWRGHAGQRDPGGLHQGYRARHGRSPEEGNPMSQSKAYLEHVAFWVQDIQWHIRFFSEVCGMTMREVQGDVEQPAQYWTLGGLQFIHQPDFAGPEGRLAHLGIMCEDLEAALAAAQRFGVSEMPQGRNWLRLPDGLAVEFIQALPAKCVAQALAIDPRAEVQA